MGKDFGPGSMGQRQGVFFRQLNNKLRKFKIKNIKIKKIFPHLLIIIALMFITMLITDFFNNAIQLLEGTNFKILLFLFCAVSITAAVISIVDNWDK